MEKILKKTSIIYSVFMVISLFFCSNSLMAAITGVIVTSVSPGTTYAASNYYKSGTAYVFQVNVTTDEADFTGITDVSLTLPGTTDIVLSVNPDAIGGTPAVTVSGGDTSGATCSITGTDFQNFNVVFTYTPTVATVTEFPYTVGNLVFASATSISTITLNSAAVPTNYGIIDTGIDAGDVAVTGADAGDTYATVSGYYINSGATVPYDFTVDVVADGHNWACVTNVTLTITSGTDINLSVTPPAAGGSGIAVSVSGGDPTGVATCDFPVWSSGATMTVTFHYTPSTSVSEIARGSNNISATATSVFGGGAVASVAFPATYGIVRIGMNSVDVSSVAAGTALTPGNFYLPANTYDYTVTVNADGHDWNCITDITLTITSGTNITLSVAPPSGGGIGVAGTAGGGDATGTVTCDFSAWTVGLDGTVTFHYTPSWSASEIVRAAHNISATALSEFDSVAVSDPTPTSYIYGVCSTGKVINVAMSPTAADGYVNPWDATFNITGNIVYNVTGAVAVTDDIPTAYITADVELFFDIDTDMVAGYEDTDVDSSQSDAAQDPAFTVNVPAEWFAGNGQANNGIGRYDWKFRTTIGGIVRILTPAPIVSLTCDRLEVLDIQFQNGGGYDGNVPAYNRNIYTSGTQMRVQLGLQYQGSNTPSALNVIASYNYGSGVRTTNLSLAAGDAWSGWVEITNPVLGEVTSGSTLWFTYTDMITSIIDPGGDYNGGTGQSAAIRIVQDPSTPSIYWDNADSPGATNTTLTGLTFSAVDSSTITFNWTAVAADLASAGGDADFLTYRVYYRQSTAAAWSMIDNNIYPLTLGDIGTSTFTIINLQSLTSYDYYMTAVDVFGNETPYAGGFLSATTNPATSSVKISDGMTSYDNSNFAFSLSAADYPVIDSAIKIEVNIVGATQPDSLNIILAADGAGDLENGSGSLNGTVNVNYYRISTLKSAQNKWVGYISSEHALIVSGQDCRFILEAVKDSTPVYYDYGNDNDPNDQEWAFSVVTAPKFTPWPVRILNNVITKKNPAAYPAYYLTDDASVTIKVYDIKGRVVAVLLDGAYRKSGINIKENGWRGRNKAGKKVGIGLYYIHIQAKRKTDGKIIINEFKKVVVSE